VYFDEVDGGEEAERGFGLSICIGSIWVGYRYQECAVAVILD